MYSDLGLWWSVTSRSDHCNDCSVLHIIDLILTGIVQSSLDIAKCTVSLVCVLETLTTRATIRPTTSRSESTLHTSSVPGPGSSYVFCVIGESWSIKCRQLLLQLRSFPRSTQTFPKVHTRTQYVLSYNMDFIIISIKLINPSCFTIVCTHPGWLCYVLVFLL